MPPIFDGPASSFICDAWDGPAQKGDRSVYVKATVTLSIKNSIYQESLCSTGTPDSESGMDKGCEWEKEWEDIQRVRRHLDIPGEISFISRYRAARLTVEFPSKDRSIRRILEQSFLAYITPVGIRRLPQDSSHSTRPSLKSRKRRFTPFVANA